MSRIGVVFLKDVRLLWPFAALTVGLILLPAVYDLRASPVGSYLPLASALSSALFVLALVHQDPPASLRHDWLTRPVSGLEILGAKALLALAVIVVPGAGGAGLAAALDGGSVSEALLSAFADTGTQLFVGLGLLMVAAITSTLFEAAGVLIGLFLLFVVVPPVMLRLSGISEAVLFLGSGWVVKALFCLLVLSGGVAVVRFAYYRRRTSAARAAFAGTVALVPVLLALISWDNVAALQRLANKAPVPRSFSIELAPGCFEASTVDPVSDLAGPAPADGPWTAEQRREAGFGAVGFFTAVRPRGLPDGWRMVVGHVEGTAIEDDGRKLAPLAPVRFTPAWRTAPDGTLEARHPWLISRAGFDELVGRGASLRLDYDLTLLAPSRSELLSLDGRRHTLPGLGACAATARSAAAIEVTCFSAGRQPDLLTARIPGALAEEEVASGYPDFAPDLLQVTSGKHHRIVIAAPPVGADRVIVTAYEAQASVEREVVARELLGGSASSCMPEATAREGSAHTSDTGDRDG